MISVPGELSGDHPDLDAFVGGLDYAMLIVTAEHAGQRAGCLAGFSTQTSIDPFRYLICVSRSNSTHRVAAAAHHLALHQIGPDQIELARLFAEQTGESTDKFAACSWSDGPYGVPILAGCPAWLVGAVVGRLDLGDHEGLLLAPVAASSASRGTGLQFGDLPKLDPGQSA